MAFLARSAPVKTVTGMAVLCTLVARRSAVTTTSPLFALAAAAGPAVWAVAGAAAKPAITLKSTPHSSQPARAVASDGWRCVVILVPPGRRRTDRPRLQVSYAGPAPFTSSLDRMYKARGRGVYAEEKPWRYDRPPRRGRIGRLTLLRGKATPAFSASCTAGARPRDRRDNAQCRQLAAPPQAQAYDTGATPPGPAPR